MSKQTLFISYCWKDGNTYADELEAQLRDEFDVKRDKTQLIANDDIYDFMAEIANCDNVIIVLTSEYVKSLNCMLEMSYLVAQDDWSMKSMVLVIDESLYCVERKLEIINYWILRQKKSFNELDTSQIGQSIFEEELEYINHICDQIENFLKGISRRKNPSQIAIVNEVIKKSKRNRKFEEDMLAKGERFIQEFLEKNGRMTVRELASTMGRSEITTRRLVSNLVEQGVIERVGSGKAGYYVQKRNV